MWKIVQAAVLKGKFRGISQSYGIAGQDSPFYWESMFSSGEGENPETSPGKVGPLFHKTTSPDNEQEEKQEEEDEDDEIDVDEVVRKGKRSGSFLFPSQHPEEEEGKIVDEQEGIEGAQAEPLPSPLQISPAPEEYYRLVPFTPYTPTSPVKKPKETNVSWHVPESFSSKGPDVVQALSDIYTDPRIVTSANLRQTKLSAARTKSDGSSSRGKNEGGFSSQATSADSGPVLEDDPGKFPQTKKRKYDETKKVSSVAHGGTRKTIKQRRKQRPRQPNESTGNSQSEIQERHISKRVSKIKTYNTRPISLSSDEELERQNKKKAQKQRVSKNATNGSKHPHKGLKETMSSPGEQGFVFEAKDYSGSCIYPLKSRAQSAPDVFNEELQRTYVNRSRPSVSMSDVRDSHIDSSDISSDFEQD